MNDLIELLRRGGEKTELYACGECGKIYSPEIFAANEEAQHEAAKRFATECCQPRHCKYCGVGVEKHWLACARCRELKKLLKADVLTSNYGEPVFSNHVDGDWGEGYSSEVAALRERCFDNGQALPAYVHPCKAEPLEIDPQDLIDNLTSDAHEDAGDQIEDVDGLFDFIKSWNAKQWSRTYYPDNSRVIVLRPARFAVLMRRAQFLITEGTDA